MSCITAKKQFDMITIRMQLSIDSLIQTKFGLFSGKRSMADDQKIFSVVLEGVTDEIFHFIDDTLGAARRNRIIGELEELSSDTNASDNEASERLGRVIWKEISSTPELVAQLKARINYYLNKVIYDSRNYGI